MAPYRILVVDDSAFMRKIISDLIAQDRQFVIAGTAVNGAEALQMIQQLKPDAVTLDLEMPVMNGIEALQAIMKQSPVPVIMLSGISEDNTRETIKALQYGAFDFIRKPSLGAISQHVSEVGELLLEKLRIAVVSKRSMPAGLQTAEKPKAVLGHKRTLDYRKPEESGKEAKPFMRDNEQKQAAETSIKKHANNPLIKKKLPSAEPIKQPASIIKPVLQNQKLQKATQKSADKNDFTHLVAIGTSTGGPRALHEVISSLPSDFAAPVLVVQHMPPKFTKSLAQRLNNFSSLQVVEAEQGERVYAGKVYIAPGGSHMGLEKDKDGYCIKLSSEPQRNGHRPSVDVLFESLVSFTELQRHAVIMTGMGSDGTLGLKQLVASGAASAVAEAEESCIVYGMPRSAIESGAANKVLPLSQISAYLEQAILTK
ncbi:protein-glutamate methylesterase/protein-glutamine glutaminase [Paenibacillus sp. IITD108]|uniref:protein-glutamate methylesterase/protein-glutamine glutaminase n=1 Tax=Paenibacillus sp. IITD108 TaxID=3116649 RepID=UPI002F3F2C54